MSDADPYSLDSTDFARHIRLPQEVVTEEGVDFPDEPPHPLTQISGVGDLCKHLDQRRQTLIDARRPDGGMGDDAYFEFNEGVMLRTEVVVMFCIEYFRAHPEALA